MKKILIVFSLLFKLSLHAMDTESSIIEQQNAVNWANENCQENHVNYKSLSKDRYFVCAMFSKNTPKELQGTVILTTESNPWLVSLITFIIVFVFMGLLGGFSWFIIKIAEEKIIKGNYEDKPRRLNIIKSSKTSFIATMTVGLIIGILSFTFIALKKHSILKLRNGNLEEVKTILPIVSLIETKEEIVLLAVSNGRIEVLEYLIEEKQYNPNVSTKIKHTYETTPLGLALKNKSYDISDYLKKYLPTDKAVDIITASRNFDLELLKESVRLKKPTADEILDAFLVSIDVFNYEAMKYLYSLEPSIIDKQTKTDTYKIGVQSDFPIKVAIDSDNIKALKFLVSKKVIFDDREVFLPHEYCKGLVSYIAYEDKIQAFNFLLENGLKIKSDKKWLIRNLFIPIARGKRDKVKEMEKLIIKKGLINYEDFKKIKDDVYYADISKYFD